jgi:hypothetical protein
MGIVSIVFFPRRLCEVESFLAFFSFHSGRTEESGMRTPRRSRLRRIEMKIKKRLIRFSKTWPSLESRIKVH